MSSRQEEFEQLLVDHSFPFDFDEYFQPPAGSQSNHFGNLTIDTNRFDYNFEWPLPSAPTLDGTQPQSFTASYFAQQPPARSRIAPDDMASQQTQNVSVLHSIQLDPHTGPSHFDWLQFGLHDPILGAEMLHQSFPSPGDSSVATTPGLTSANESPSPESSTPSQTDCATPEPPKRTPRKGSRRKTKKAMTLAGPSNESNHVIFETTDAFKAAVAASPRSSFEALRSTNHNMKAQNDPSTSAVDPERIPRHEPRQHGKVPCPYPECNGRTFYCKSTLKRHVESHHLEIKYPCPGMPRCKTKPFSQSWSLKRHLRATPLGSHCRKEARKTGIDLEDTSRKKSRATH